MILLSLSTTLIVTFTLASAPGGRLRESSPARSSELARIVTDSQASSEERNSALSALAAADFEKAMEIAATLLADGDLSLRVRASWILADGGRESGIDVLKSMSRDRTAESVIAIRMLGRLRDPGSHDLLVGLLEQELAFPRRQGSFPDVPSAASRISALTGALADYGRKEDTALLVRTIPDKVGPGHFLEIERLGRAGGKEALPVLERVFREAAGWTAMAAGLGLGRCGSSKGLKYVRERLADTSGDPNQPNESRITNAKSDDPHGPKGTDFVLNRLGVPADEVFVPDLLRILSSPEHSWVLKAQAWRALLRMNPATERQKILDLAWGNLGNESAIKLIVMNDEARAKTAAVQFESSKAETERAAGRALRSALMKTSRERRRWREFHGYVE